MNSGKLERVAKPANIMCLKNLRRALHDFGNPTKATHLQRFFKTGPGEYGEGDVFLGVKVPEVRSLLSSTDDLSPDDVHNLLISKYHEERLLALLILVRRFKHTRYPSVRQEIFNYYVQNTRYINNWDLIDLSAPSIVGHKLLDCSRSLLYEFANSSDLWRRRISIVSTHTFIRQGQYEDTVKLCQLLLHDKHDLIHKACGWMLREVGKKNEATLIQFLDQHTPVMPRTMLRYAIERLPKKIREHYLKLPRSPQ